MRKKYVLLAVIVMITLCFISCGKKYSEEEIIGLTSSEVIEKYGDFDRAQGSPGEDGLYRDCSCGYLISEEKVGYLGTTPPEYFMIDFDKDGVAFQCRYEQVV